MRLAPFALLALCSLPACAPDGYGYSGAYGTPAYGTPAYGSPDPAYYGSPYYSQPGYVAPPVGGVVVFGGERDERRGYDRRYDNRRGDYDQRGPRYDQRAQERPARPPQQQQRPPSVFAGPQRGGGGHAPDFNPSNPNAQGGADR